MFYKSYQNIEFYFFIIFLTLNTWSRYNLKWCVLGLVAISLQCFENKKNLANHNFDALLLK